MKKKFLVCMIALTITTTICGCQKQDAVVKTVQYSKEVGVAEGSVQFAEKKEPVIDIKDIKAYVGEEIDYSTGINIKNAELYEDFQMWVDATKVDIYTAGKYVATYRFVYDGKEVEKTVGITIMEKETGGDSVSKNQQNEDSHQTEQKQTSVEATTQLQADVPEQEDTTVPQSTSVQTQSNSETEASQEQTQVQSTTQSPTQGTTQSATQSPTKNTVTENTTTKSSEKNTTKKTENKTEEKTTKKKKKEIVTTTMKGTKKPSLVGYTNIELLSGKYVKIKCTDSKYIVSTRTDVTTKKKNKVKYKISKLIVTYNNGKEQVLETVEKVVK